MHKTAQSTSNNGRFYTANDFLNKRSSANLKKTAHINNQSSTDEKVCSVYPFLENYFNVSTPDI